MEEVRKKRIVFGCGFCGQECPGDLQVALVRNPGGDDEEAQWWFAHFGCFANALHPSARYFGDWDDDDSSLT